MSDGKLQGGLRTLLSRWETRKLTETTPCSSREGVSVRGGLKTPGNIGKDDVAEEEGGETE